MQPPFSLPAKFTSTTVYLFVILVVCLSTQNLQAQKILLLEKAGTVKNIKYKLGDNIQCKVNENPNLISGAITKLSDSSMTLDYVMELKFHNILLIKRSMWTREWMPELFVKASIGYFLVIGINNILQKVGPVMPADVLTTSLALATTGVVLNLLLIKNYNLNKNWRIRVLDFDSLK